MTQIENTDPKTLGRWTKIEHEKFLLGLQIYGKDWKKIQELIGTRNGAQIRSHAQKFFLRMKKQFELEPTNDTNNPTSQLAPEIKNQESHHGTQSQESHEYSYFVQKIVKKSHEKEKFDFWEAFIDQKSCEEMHDLETGISKRKSSFIAWDQNDLEGPEHGEPCKKVKTQ